jgi:hypothetical protein
MRSLAAVVGEFEENPVEPSFSSMHFSKKSKAQVKNSETNSPNLRISLTLVQPTKSMA